MRITKIFLVLFLFELIFIGCENNVKENGGLHGMKFGKNLTITVSEDESIDAEYLQRVLDGEIKKDVPYFDVWDEKELKNLIDYMAQNGYIIVPGQYTFNQAWLFENGMFVLNNGERREIFKFETKDN